jgi:nitrate reductase gamma subunit
MWDIALFVAFPYLAIIIAVLVGVYRYFIDRYSFTSLSSQFLETRKLFWGSVPWHYGVVIVLTAHVLALLVPMLWAILVGGQVRLYVFELTGWALALGSIFGLTMLVVRRLLTPRAMAVTSWIDWLLLSDLLLQVVLGFIVAFFYRWGSLWYLHTAVPWLVSLATFTPQTQYVSALPPLVQLHFLNGFLLILIFPFTRLVHLVTFPITYWWRPYQVVIWNRGDAKPGSK